MNDFLLSIFKSEYPITQGYHGNWWDKKKDRFEKGDKLGNWAYLNKDGSKGMHGGTDIGVREGTPIFAPFSGEIQVENNGSVGYGLYIWVIDGNRKVRICHLSAVQYKDGDNVAEGEFIALSGDTGYSTAPHAHIEVWVDGARVDPQLYEIEKNAHDATWAWGLAVGLCTEKSERKRQLTFEETVTVLNRLVKHLESSSSQQPGIPSGK